VGGYTSQIATLAAINAIATLGFYVTMTSGQLSIAHGTFFAIGAYAGGYVMVHSGVPLAVGILAALAAGAIAAIPVFPAVRLRGLYFAVATFAFGSAVAAGLIHVSAVGGPFGLVGIPLETTLTITMVALVIVFALVQLLDHSPLYVALTASRDDPEVAAALGLKVSHLRRVTLIAGAALTGIAGALYASSVGVVTPTDASFDRSLELLLMAVIGGSRTSWGAILGAVIWTVTPEVLRFADDANTRLILFGCLAIAVMAFRPQGLLDRGDFGRVYRLVRRPSPPPPAAAPTEDKQPAAVVSDREFG
jgi:branched-chain amino acid transport system permease protein